MNCSWHEIDPETSYSLLLKVACPRRSNISKGQHDLATHLTKQEKLKIVCRLQLHASLICVILQARECAHDNPVPVAQGRSEVKAVSKSEAQSTRGAGLLQMRPSHCQRKTNLSESSTHVSQPVNNLVGARYPMTAGAKRKQRQQRRDTPALQFNNTPTPGNCTAF